LSAVCLAILCVTASGSSPTYSLILRPRIQLNAFQGVPANLSYTPVDGVIHDLNSDGAPDIVIGVNGSHPAVYFNNGTADPFASVPGVFVSPPSTNMIAWGAVAVSDVNADGHPDLAMAGFNASNKIYLNDGTATPFNNVSPVAIGTVDVSNHPAFGDVNGDGFVDMAVANTNHVPSRVYLTQGAPLTSGTYSVAQVGTPAGGYGQSAVIADINGDARPDLILGYIMGSWLGTDPEGIEIYLNDGTGDPFGNVMPTQLLAGQSVLAIAVADVNQDTRLDLVTSVSEMGTAPAVQSVFLNTASSSEPFSSSQALQPNGNLGGGCLDIAVADVNSDARPDLLFACAAPAWNADPMPASPAVGSIYLHNGTANPFGNVSPVNIPAAAGAFGRSVDVGTLVANAAPAILVVDHSSNYGAYYPTVLAQDPVAQNDSAIVAINTTLQIDVLANDIAAPGQMLDSSSLKITETPQHGTATVTGGWVTYAPASGYSGVDVFAYTVRDSLGAWSQRAVVNIVVQPAPVAVNDLRTLSAGQSVTLDVLANDTSSGGTLDAASITIAVQPVNGTAVVTNGQVAYTPAAGYAGVDAFQYSVRDNLGTPSNVATVSLSVQPTPVATNDTSSVQANGSVTINVVANDRSEGGTLDGASIVIVNGPAHGTATVSNGSVIYTPSVGYSGSDSFQYSVRDNLGATSNAATVSVQVSAPPRASSGGGGGGSFGLPELLALLGFLVTVGFRRTRE
jgi:hypothetical protein